ncbi:MAG TPA: response regulator [Methylomirabilota bacterium]|nr:response regulator [Methylomirabilota bacterium]
MAKILVADDNSNIQKMVGLALKDQGIDVVAVGNGEAAVRKISDVRPDLVLADVFMPVRNGYEVCQYVKTDSALSHIPVILLVGAFDPLDEQEAQRVGADGVLKKPFVPPDPLISMVKSALQRAGVDTGGPAPARSSETETLRAADLLTPRAPSAPTQAASPVQIEHGEPAAITSDESFVDEAPVRPEPVRIDSGAQPVAFGSLLETPAEEPVEEQSFVSPAHPDFVAERDWRGKVEDEAEEEEEEKPASSWRREESEAFADSGPGSNSKNWRATAFEQIEGGKSRSTGWEHEEETRGPAVTAPAASNSAAESVATPPAVVHEAPPTAPFGTDRWEPAVPSVLKETSPATTATAVEEVAHMATEAPSAPIAPKIQPPEPAKPEPEKQESKETWLSTPLNPWDAEIKKATQLASTWDTPATSNAAASSNGTEKSAAPVPVSEETKAAIEEAALPPEAVQAIREEAAQAAENATQAAEQQAPEGSSCYYASEEVLEKPEAPAAPAAAEPSMDDLVARVLSKMSPDVLQAVTKEILKPVVEAMVKEELKSKKP